MGDEDFTRGNRLRPLSQQETAALERLGCRCDDWSGVTAEEPFAIKCYRNVTFHGRVALGRAGAAVSNPAGIPCRCGIYDAVIADCSVGRNVYINRVTGGLRNLDILDATVIDSVYSIVCSSSSSFGNGVKVNVMSETGGRDVIITDHLSAPEAYLQAFHRHNASLSKRLSEAAGQYAASRRADRSPIGPGAEICNCGSLTDVAIIGESRVNGAAHLVNGTIRNASVGAGVTAGNFIFLDGSTVDSGANIHDCLVGQGATIASGFTAHDSLIFANCHLENGEAAAVFAGPFTTSMHKSTLLIGGLFSFFNAGSGTNQSNHLYKLGPMHQGITLRGCKTGSDSYILWPAAAGAFTTILGHHYSHPDTRDFPFSLLVNDRLGRSMLLPGHALSSVGLARDVEKWPTRDRRDDVDSKPLDPVNHHWLSPFTVSAILRGLGRLHELAASAEMQINGETETNGVVTTLKAVTNGIRNYRLAISVFTAGILRRKILAVTATNPEITTEGLLEALRAEPGSYGTGPWMDMAGMFAPRPLVDKAVSDFIASAGETSTGLARRLAAIHDNYLPLSWSWAWHNLGRLASVSAPDLTATEVNASNLTATEVTALLRQGAEAALKLEQMFTADAAKEFDPATAALGFGIDSAGDQAEINDDFSRARGFLAGQRFLAMLHRRVQTFTGSLAAITENAL